MSEPKQIVIEPDPQRKYENWQAIFANDLQALSDVEMERVQELAATAGKEKWTVQRLQKELLELIKY